MRKKFLPITKEEEKRVFPEEFTLLIEEILKKHGLYKTHEEGAIKILESRDSKEKREILESLPGYIIAKFVKEFADSKVTSEELLSLLRENIDLPENGIKKLAKDIAEDILVFIKPIKEKRGIPTPSEVKPPTISPEKSRPVKKDTYRELIE